MWLSWLWWCCCCYIAGVVSVITAAWWWLNQREDVKPVEKLSVPRVELPASLAAELQAAGGTSGNGPHLRETCQGLSFLMQFFFQEKQHDLGIIRWLSNVLTLELGELLKHRALSKIVRNMQIRDLSLGSNFPVIKSITTEKITLNPETQMLDLIELSMDISYTGGFQLAIDATTKFSKTASIKVKIMQLSGRGRLQFSRNPFTHWSFSFYEEPQSEFDVESSVLGRHIPRFRSIIVSQLRSVLRRRHTLPYYKLRSRPLVPPGLIAATMIAAAGGSPAPCRTAAVLPEDGCSVPQGKLVVTILGCSRLQPSLVVGGVFCSVLLAAEPVVCAWDEGPSDDRSGEQGAECAGSGVQFVVMEVLAKKVNGASVGIMLRNNQDKLQVVDSIDPQSAAALAGVRAGDALLAVNGVRVTSAAQGARLLALTPSKAASFRGSRNTGGGLMGRGKSLSTSNLRGSDTATDGRHTTAAMLLRIKRSTGDGRKDCTGTAVKGRCEAEVISNVSSAASRADCEGSDSESSTCSDAGRRALLGGEGDPLLQAGGGDTALLATHALRSRSSSPSFTCCPDNAVSSSGAQEAASDLPDRPTTCHPSSAEGDGPAPDPPTVHTSVSSPAVGAASPKRGSSQPGRPASTKSLPSTRAGRDGTNGDGKNSSKKTTSVKQKSLLRIESTTVVEGTNNPLFDTIFEYWLEEDDKFVNISVWSCGSLSTVDDSGENDEPKPPQESRRARYTNGAARRLRRDGSSDKKTAASVDGSAEGSRLVCGAPPHMLLGYVVLPLIAIVPEMTLNTRGHVVKVVPLRPPDPACPQADAYKLGGHKGFEPSLCYGDITLSCLYQPSDRCESKKGSSLTQPCNSDEESNSDGGGAVSEEESVADLADSWEEGGQQRQHDFKRTHFSSATQCDFCRKKIWLKEACQCGICGVICHKKCVVRCKRETVCSPQQQQTEDGASERWLVGEPPSSSREPPEIVMTGAGAVEEASDWDHSTTPAHTPQSHRRTLSSLLASMKGSSLAAPVGAIKRAGSATNLTSLSTTSEDQLPRNTTSASNSVTASMGRSFASKVPFVALELSIKRTGSVNNIASSARLADEKMSSSCLAERPSVTARAGKKTSEMIASLSKSGVMLFVDERNLSRPECQFATTPPSSRTSLSPSQFFRTKRSSSSNRCSADPPAASGGDQSMSSPSAGQRRADRPLSSPVSIPPHLSTSQSNSDSLVNSCTQRFLQQVPPPHLTSIISRSLPPSPQHSSPPSPQHSPPPSPQRSPPRSLENSPPRSPQCSPPQSPKCSLPRSPQHSPPSSPQHSPPHSPQHSPLPPRKARRSPSPGASNPFAVFTSDNEACVQQTLQLLQRCPHQDESLLLLARQSAPALLTSLPPLLRKPRIAATLERVQSLVDDEGVRRLQLAQAEGDARDGASRSRVLRDIEQCDARTQALALLSMFLFTALHLCQDQIEEQRQAEERRDGGATQD